MPYAPPRQLSDRRPSTPGASTLGSRVTDVVALRARKPTRRVRPLREGQWRRRAAALVAWRGAGMLIASSSLVCGHAAVYGGDCHAAVDDGHAPCESHTVLTLDIASRAHLRMGRPPMPLGRVGRMHLGLSAFASPGLRCGRKLSEPLTTFAGSSVALDDSFTDRAQCSTTTPCSHHLKYYE
ncbi:uncharacterized protein SCHCODRAFT_02042066 [Schizophyllum commune H4-8]|uniref:uncharacterized protein n=1 Tax=Schizophyllum commune (strain H4-8 / FGSC 9210) TaxID=578458 RepID=UPI002160E7DD|nr:uncharacterized protein SCHCODRAFT_02042066 [Schizophyllum commune H4-8]KAI5900678.1 hypothetical protein SCHCODRAFT_02042066 [Schizophyllum commune H4-8]